MVPDARPLQQFNERQLGARGAALEFGGRRGITASGMIYNLMTGVATSTFRNSRNPLTAYEYAVLW